MTSAKSPIVSVIIPAYNQALFISEAIQSVLNQTLQNFELIVVDDGSTDETPSILASVLDPRVRIIHQPNAGLSAARNTGLRESSAPLVSFLDSDDYFFPDKLALLARFLDEHPEIGVVSGGYEIVDQDGHPLREMIQSSNHFELLDLLTNNPFTATSVLVRRFWFDLTGDFDQTLRACEDWDLWIRMAYAGCRFAWVEHLVVAYRYHPRQMTRESERMRKAIMMVLAKFFNQSGLPENLTVFKEKAFATGLLHAVVFEYIAKEFDKGEQDLAEAVRLDPALKENNYKKLVDFLVGWSNDPRSSSPAEFLEKIQSNLPADLPDLGRQLRCAIAEILLGPLFSSKREDRHFHKAELIKAIRYRPALILNKGVLRMVYDAWLMGIS